MWGRAKKILLSLPFLIVAGLFVLYLVFGFFLVNPLAQKLLPWIGENKLASQLSARQVKFNPLTLEATVDGLKLAQMDGQQLAGFDRLYVNLETSGLFRFAWRLRDVQLDGPVAFFEVARGGKLNWADLIAKLNEDKKPPSDTMPRVLVERIRISDGDISYTDANRPGKPFKVVLEPLGLELDGLSTLPEDRGDYLIAAELPEHGGKLRWKGDVALNPVASSGEIALENVQITKLLRVIKSPRNFELPSGTLAAGLRYRFDLLSDPSGAAVPSLQIDGANLVLQKLVLAHRGSGEPVLQLAEAQVRDASFGLLERKVEVAGVSLVGGRLSATRDVRGRLDWQTLFAAAESPAVADAAEPAGIKTAAEEAPWKIGVREISVADWSASFSDRGFAQPLSASIENFGLSAALTAEVGATTAIEVGPVNAALGPVRLRSGTQPVASLQKLALINAGFSLADNRLAIEAVELNGLKTTLALDKQKNLNWSDILKPAPRAAAAAPVKSADPDAAPIDVRLARLSLDGIEVGVVDESPATPVRLDIVKGSVTLKDLSLDMVSAVPLKELEIQRRKGVVPLQASFSLRQGGRLVARGTAVPAKRSGSLDLELSGLSLQTFAPYLNQFARLDLRSGAASSRGKLAYAQTKTGMKLDYDGGFAVDDLAITEEETGEAFLGWKKLSSDSLTLGLGPNRLHINELVALNPFGKIIIFEDQSLNLKRILRDQGTPEAATGEAQTGAEAPVTATVEVPDTPRETAAEAAPPAFPVAIERIRIDGANLDFADLSLTPQFGALIHSLSGVINGLSNDPGTTALVELDGQVDDYGSTRIRGSLQPFQATEFTDLELSFRNLEMTRLTPYSGKFAGRKIDSGKLSVDLQYKIKQRQLAGENKFVINRLKLGERIDSPTAMKLPLDLAIALLQDSNGIIDLDLPISGSLDDPQFSYGKIVWKAIVNVLTKLVTAPFRALGSLLGVSAEKLESVGFDPGSSALLPPEQEKLKTLAEALAKRPALTLTLKPGYDPEADRRALQEQTMRRQAAAVAGIKLAAGEAPGPVDVNNYKIQTWLEDSYAKTVGKEEYKTLRASFKDKDAGLMESQMVERLARRLKTRDEGPASAFHAELLERLTRQTKIADDALVKLAQARGEAIRDSLVTLGLEPDRVGIDAPIEQSAKDKLVGSKMSLGARKLPAETGQSTAAENQATPTTPAP
jgi:uncharacterized protein involved in outer membrane biogenesis